jgi:glycosyltransferase involved in cell wall biosynthesis
MKKENPKVSIMISVFNQLHCLHNALESALNQDYPNLEIVIGDDYSTDGDVNEFVAKYDDLRIKYFRNPENLGVSGNYRKLLYDYATGDLAVMLNADDYYIDKSFIKKAVSYFCTHNDLALVFSDIKVYLVSEDRFYEDECNRSLPELMNGDELFLDYWKGYSLPHLTCIYDRKHAMSIGFYTSESISADWESLFRLILGKQVAYINEPKGVLTRHDQNFTKAAIHYLKDNATDYIEKPFEFAKNQQRIKMKKLEKWRQKMLKRYFIKCLVKLQFIDEEIFQNYKIKLKQEYPDFYKQIMIDYRYLGYKFIKKNPKLLKVLFRFFYHQESFIADLLANKRSGINTK